MQSQIKWQRHTYLLLPVSITLYDCLPLEIPVCFLPLIFVCLTDSRLWTILNNDYSFCLREKHLDYCMHFHKQFPINKATSPCNKRVISCHRNLGGKIWTNWWFAWKINGSGGGTAQECRTILELHYPRPLKLAKKLKKGLHGGQETCFVPHRPKGLVTEVR